MADRVHPTAFGQIAIAERALAVLGATVCASGGAGVADQVRDDVAGRLRGDLTYAYRAPRSGRGDRCGACARGSRGVRWTPRAVKRTSSIDFVLELIGDELRRATPPPRAPA